MRLIAVAAGLVVGMPFRANWRPALQFQGVRSWLPVASQHLVAAEVRAAATVLGLFTREVDAPLIDSWLQRMPQETFGATLNQIQNHPAPTLRQRWVAMPFERWSRRSKANALVLVL